MTNGSRERTFHNPSGVLFTETGHLRISKEKLQEIAAYHVLIIVRDSNLTPTGSGTTRMLAKTVTTLSWVGIDTWKNKDEISRSVSFEYDGKKGGLTIGQFEFPTRENNMFILMIEKDWSFSVVELPDKIKTMEDEHAVLQKYQSVSNIPEVKTIKLSD